MDNDTDYELNVRLVDAGQASGYATNTDDDCGSGNTGSNACTTNADAGGGY
ncbi:hypothetical protein Acsp04_62810 [Actinomadura sp. NBRC 104425]|uniref:FxLD family lanthipeptide n=1 Tax=Actinomadura sp. NBRC 104425 TaxID=3032204 RepID=UPI00249FD5CA|nr:FxLD family lanthipeptide [Actinomadura sp. NBRC 104425]GLZ16046.1 hypothetical protein Acsp04_62810 [Actinomadura sp. NBRC 104425]